MTLTKNDESYEALKAVGQSIGIVSLGKRIVLIEGEESSLDKSIYSELIRGRFDDLVLLPSGGRETLEMFSRVSDAILSRTVWGIDFFMLTDRDTMPLDAGTQPRIRTLNRYHLENYFLDPDILADCFRPMEQEDSPFCDPDAIRAILNELARETLPYATALIVARKLRFSVGNLSMMPKLKDAKTAADLRRLLLERAALEVKRISEAVDSVMIEQEVEQTFGQLQQKLNDDQMAWINDLPGKPIFSKFAARAAIEKGRLKSLYVAESRRRNFAPFEEIIDIFASFSGRAPAAGTGPITLRKGKPRSRPRISKAAK